MNRSKIARANRALVAAALLLTAAGCSMARLRQDIAQLDRLALVSGRIAGVADDHVDIEVILLRESPGGEPAIEELATLSPAFRSYAFAVQAGAAYRIAAYVDLDGDGVPDAGEPAGEAAPGTIRLAADERRLDVDIALSPATALAPRWSSARSAAASSARRLPITAGEIVALDDPRFALDEATRGMWQPLRSSLERGVGVYFLEPYDPGRIPVLFVHGIGGTPRDFTTAIAGLDRTRFQPWLFAYPSGVRLERTAHALAEILLELERSQRFSTLAVTAHSMGGLLSRAAILELARRDRADLVDLFVTFATPWNGHAAATHGVRFAPSVVPAWIDMQPGSDFLATIRTPLPTGLPFFLLFGFDTGGYNPLMVYSHDTVISVASQLAPWAQDEARGIWGFEATHETILEQPDPLRRWRALIESLPDPTARGNDHESP